MSASHSFFFLNALHPFPNSLPSRVTGGVGLTQWAAGRPPLQPLSLRPRQQWPRLPAPLRGWWNKVAWWCTYGTLHPSPAPSPLSLCLLHSFFLFFIFSIISFCPLPPFLAWELRAWWLIANHINSSPKALAMFPFNYLADFVTQLSQRHRFYLFFCWWWTRLRKNGFEFKKHCKYTFFQLLIARIDALF